MITYAEIANSILMLIGQLVMPWQKILTISVPCHRVVRSDGSVGDIFRY